MKVLLFFIVLCAVSPLKGEPLVSMYAVHMPTQTVLLEKNSQVSLVPASCMKIVTTGAALRVLNEEYRFETHLEYDGTIDQGILHGNVYIKGGGDPCLGSDRISPALSWEKQIKAWSQAVAQLGISKIEGSIIADATGWEHELAVPSWCWEDLGNYYGAGACALSFHENFYHLFFEPSSKEGEATKILRTDPPLPGLTLHNEVLTGPPHSGDQACIYGSEHSFSQTVRGTIPALVKEFSIKGAIPDPSFYCALLFEQGLKKQGIVVEKQPLSPKERTSFHVTYSPPLKDIVIGTNQKSINLYAEHLLKKMGELVCKKGSTQKGIEAVTQFWKTKIDNLEGFYMADGSGLSRKNLITTKQLVSMLLTLKDSSTFLASLPQRNENCRAKTGSMSLIRGVVGYYNDVAFALLINHCPNSKISEKITDEFFATLKTKIDNATEQLPKSGQNQKL